MEKNKCDRKEVESRKQKAVGHERGLGPLAEYFPLIRTRQEFLEICTGGKGLKVLFDGIFKEIFNPEVTPERLERLLTLLYTDLLIQQKDGSFCNVEIQKIG